MKTLNTDRTERFTREHTRVYNFPDRPKSKKMRLPPRAGVQPRPKSQAKGKTDSPPSRTTESLHSGQQAGLEPLAAVENRTEITLGSERKEKPPLLKREEKVHLFTSMERTP